MQTQAYAKHHLDTADAKRPKHHLDTSRKPPKPQAKKLFHITFGIHIKPIFGATEHMCKHKPMQTPSGHCRCKKTQTPSRHEPKTAQTASQKTVSRYLWNPHKTIFGATEHMPSLCKHKPMQTPSGHCRCKKTQTPSRHEPKTAQTASQKKTVSHHLWNPHKTIFGATEHMCKHKPMQTPSGHCRCKKTQTPSRHEPKTAQTASQKTVSHYLWNPHKNNLWSHRAHVQTQAYANTIWTLQMQKDPNTI